MVAEWTHGVKNLFNKWLPVLLMASAGVSLFLFQNQQNGFGLGHHGFLSGHGLTLAKSLVTGEHPLLMFMEKQIQNDKVSYMVYDRFPVFPFLIIGLLTRLFEPDLALQIYVARQIMNTFLFLAMIVVFKMISEITRDKFMSLSITFVCFSSY